MPLRIFAALVLSIVVSGCSTTTSGQKTNAASAPETRQFDPAKFPALDPLESLVRERAKHSMAEAVKIAADYGAAIRVNLNGFDVSNIKAEMDKDRTIYWFVDFRRHAVTRPAEGDIVSFIVNDSTGAVKKQIDMFELARKLKSAFPELDTAPLTELPADYRPTSTSEAATHSK